MDACRVCGNTQNNQRHVFQEKYFGLGDEFEYIECSVCRSLSIVDLPDNMERYYPETYYSYTVRTYNRLYGYLKGKRDLYYLGQPGIVGYFLSRILPAPPYIEWLQNLSLPFGASILEVGSGGGALVVNLQGAGFLATGIDPYIRKSLTFPNGARVLKQSLEETSGSYDCIMLHHCLEHMAAPRDAFGHFSRLLKPGGKLLVRVPLAGSHAWLTYGRNWFQLDAPRHFVIFSEEGLCRLAAEQGYETSKIVYDSTASQFWASEQYVRDITLASERSHAVHPEKSIFSVEQIAEYSRQAALLNARHAGDQASYYFHKVA